MSTKITKCPSCDSTDIILCTITAECNVCNQRFTFKSGTSAGRRKGVKY